MMEINNNKDLIKQFDFYVKCYIDIKLISPNTINESKQFLINLTNIIQLKSFLISSSEDGEINFYWHEKDRFLLDLGFKGDSIYSYYCRLPNGTEIDEDGVSINTQLPKDIVDQLSV